MQCGKKKKDMPMTTKCMKTSHTKSKITRMVERKERVSGQVEVLKKQQKVASESLIKECEAQKVALANSIQAQIANLKAQIETLKIHEKTQCAAYDQKLKVDLDKIINTYDAFHFTFFKSFFVHY